MFWQDFLNRSLKVLLAAGEALFQTIDPTAVQIKSQIKSEPQDEDERPEDGLTDPQKEMLTKLARGARRYDPAQNKRPTFPNAQIALDEIIPAHDTVGKVFRYDELDFRS